MGRGEKKAFRTGIQRLYVTRTRARKKLRLTLPEFRKLCILKGVYPRDPKKKRSGPNKTYFHLKDLAYMAHDPLVQNFRDFRIFKRKLRKRLFKDEPAAVQSLKENVKPNLVLDHVIRERYPSFTDALRDLDDALSMIFLFAHHQQNVKVHAQRVATCARLAREWECFVAVTHTLTKVFVSIKGVYYQANIMGQRITWVVPHQFSVQPSKDVDYKVMLTFLDLYQTLLAFVNFKLFTSIGMHYPPDIDMTKDAAGEHIKPPPKAISQKPAEFVAMSEDKANSTAVPEDSEIQSRIQELDEILAEVDKEQALSTQNEEDTPTENPGADAAAPEEPELATPQAPQRKLLFSGYKFFLNREVPVRSLELVILSNGGEVSWEGEKAPYLRNDSSITHEVVDRERVPHTFIGREYIQPQWVYDSVNEGLPLPVHEYFQGVKLPVHLSPFIDDQKRGYVPDRRLQLDQYKARWKASQELQAETAPNQEDTGVDQEGRKRQAEEEPETAQTPPKKRAKVAFSTPPKTREEKDEEKRLTILLPGKKRKIFSSMKRREERKKKAISHLEQKRDSIQAKKTKGSKE